jgi:hypothetical protein
VEEGDAVADPEVDVEGVRERVREREAVNDAEGEAVELGVGDVPKDGVTD